MFHAKQILVVFILVWSFFGAIGAFPLIDGTERYSAAEDMLLGPETLLDSTELNANLTSARLSLLETAEVNAKDSLHLNSKRPGYVNDAIRDGEYKGYYENHTDEDEEAASYPGGFGSDEDIVATEEEKNETDVVGGDRYEQNPKPSFSLMEVDEDYRERKTMDYSERDDREMWTEASMDLEMDYEKPASGIVVSGQDFNPMTEASEGRSFDEMESFSEYEDLFASMPLVDKSEHVTPQPMFQSSKDNTAIQSNISPTAGSTPGKKDLELSPEDFDFLFSTSSKSGMKLVIPFSSCAKDADFNKLYLLKKEFDSGLREIPVRISKASSSLVTKDSTDKSTTPEASAGASSHGEKTGMDDGFLVYNPPLPARMEDTAEDLDYSVFNQPGKARHEHSTSTHRGESLKLTSHPKQLPQLHPIERSSEMGRGADAGDSMDEQPPKSSEYSWIEESNDYAEGDLSENYLVVGAEKSILADDDDDDEMLQEYSLEDDVSEYNAMDNEYMDYPDGLSKEEFKMDIYFPKVYNYSKVAVIPHPESEGSSEFSYTSEYKRSEDSSTRMDLDEDAKLYLTLTTTPSSVDANPDGHGSSHEGTAVPSLPSMVYPNPKHYNVLHSSIPESEHLPLATPSFDADGFKDLAVTSNMTDIPSAQQRSEYLNSLSKVQMKSFEQHNATGPIERGSKTSNNQDLSGTLSEKISHGSASSDTDLYDCVEDFGSAETYYGDDNTVSDIMGNNSQSSNVSKSSLHAHHEEVTAVSTMGKQSGVDAGHGNSSGGPAQEPEGPKVSSVELSSSSIVSEYSIFQDVGSENYWASITVSDSDRENAEKDPSLPAGLPSPDVQEKDSFETDEDSSFTNTEYETSSTELVSVTNFPAAEKSSREEDEHSSLPLELSKPAHNTELNYTTTTSPSLVPEGPKVNSEVTSSNVLTKDSSNFQDEGSENYMASITVSESVLENAERDPSLPAGLPSPDVQEEDKSLMTDEDSYSTDLKYEAKIDSIEPVFNIDIPTNKQSILEDIAHSSGATKLSTPASNTGFNNTATGSPSLLPEGPKADSVEVASSSVVLEDSVFQDEGSENYKASPTVSESDLKDPQKDPSLPADLPNPDVQEEDETLMTAEDSYSTDLEYETNSTQHLNVSNTESPAHKKSILEENAHSSVSPEPSLPAPGTELNVSREDTPSLQYEGSGYESTAEPELNEEMVSSPEVEATAFSVTQGSIKNTTSISGGGTLEGLSAEGESSTDDGSENEASTTKMTRLAPIPLHLEVFSTWSSQIKRKSEH
ncbi:uro-adherence factor A [Amia ocellicauda]|uniref:uro-adherence factor A n=1 Tax=Amia ocellicauda TaxID=2972642 RepID=UPI003463E4A8